MYVILKRLTLHDFGTTADRSYFILLNESLNKITDNILENTLAVFFNQNLLYASTKF